MSAQLMNNIFDMIIFYDRHYCWFVCFAVCVCIYGQTGLVSDLFLDRRQNSRNFSIRKSPHNGWMKSGICMWYLQDTDFAMTIAVADAFLQTKFSRHVYCAHQQSKGHEKIIDLEIPFDNKMQPAAFCLYRRYSRRQFVAGCCTW